MDKIYDWIRSIVIYMIMNTIIMNLLGNSSYKKYISVISGMILVLIVISPLLELLHLDLNLDYYLASNDFAIETSDFENRLRRMEQKQMNEIFGEYQEKLKASIQDLLASEEVFLDEFHLEFDKDQKSPSFGVIKGMDIKASIKNEENTKENDAKDKILIERVIIDRIAKRDKEESKLDQLPTPLEIKIKNKLSDFYNIEPDNINISIQGG
ncbi:MAG: stage III sporulation protein AF [Clostridiales bacterium]|nr:stage III sporulation protein AF [Clostridiales bacterium]